MNFSRDSSRSSQPSPSAYRSSSRASSILGTRILSLEESPPSSRGSKRCQTSDHVERAHSNESSHKRRRLESTSDSASHMEVLSSPQFSSLLSSLLDEKLGPLKEALSTALALGIDARDLNSSSRTQDFQPDDGPAPHVSNDGLEEDSMDALYCRKSVPKSKGPWIGASSPRDARLSIRRVSWPFMFGPGRKKTLRVASCPTGFSSKERGSAHG